MPADKNQELGVGQAAWENTSLALSDDANAQSLLKALIDHFNKVKIKVTYKCDPHRCKDLTLAMAAGPSIVSTTVAANTDVSASELSEQSVSDLPVVLPVSSESSTRLLAIAVDNSTQSLVLQDVTASAATTQQDFCKKIVITGVTGDSHGDASFHLKVTFEFSLPPEQSRWKLT
jgi:hypothetical protein